MNVIRLHCVRAYSINEKKVGVRCREKKSKHSKKEAGNKSKCSCVLFLHKQVIVVRVRV